MANETTQNDHLDALRLDACRAGEGTPEELRHLASCEACRKELAALKRLAAAVARDLDKAIEIPTHVDDAVIAFARRRLSSSGKRVVYIRRLAWAAAAAILLVVGGVSLRSYLGGREPASATYDVDGSGEVDILDAFSLALSVESAGGKSNSGDVDGDGVVDRRDVDAIATAVVALNGAGL